ncbi:MAG: EAL domain-containing protein [Erythrobacter sp.]
MKLVNDRRENATDAVVREMYGPVLRGYFAVFALYYVVMVPLNLFTMDGSERYYLVATTGIAAAVALLGSYLMHKNVRGDSIDSVVVTLNVLIICNVLVALRIDFSEAKLVYFLIITMLFGLASWNFRQSATSIAFSFAALFTFLQRVDMSTAYTYAFLVFATALASLALAIFLRRAVMRIAESKFEAEGRLEEVRKAASKLRSKALTDSLTGLPNRRAFFNALDASVERVSRANESRGEDAQGLWLILMDLDGFKAVNDVHGHGAGDLLLQEVAKRLRVVVGEDTHVSRMGGDEFCMLAVNALSERDIELRCNRLLEAISKPYSLDGRHVAISCSIGSKRMELDQDSRSQIHHADYALMVAKKQGKNRVVMFDEVQAREAGERLRIENALRHAMLEEEIEIVFQPQVDLNSNVVERAEVLARWESADVGKIEPQRFIKIAEESGLITGITLLVVNKALKELASWQHKIPLSINLSCHDLISDSTIDAIIEMAIDAGIDAAMIEFEVTETAMMADFEKAAANLRRMSDAGYSIALDDFGTGYSNFSYLRALPIDKLKIDRSFIENPGDPMTEKMLASLVGMARVLGVNCLLEGVEDEVRLVMAKRAGVESVQGYLFGKPMDAVELQILANTDLSKLKAG